MRAPLQLSTALPPVHGVRATMRGWQKPGRRARSALAEDAARSQPNRGTWIERHREYARLHRAELVVVGVPFGAAHAFVSLRGRLLDVARTRLARLSE